MDEVPPQGADALPEASYTIDELAALTRVPSRTIRFYQSKGVLPKPTIQGRKASYDRSHVARLELIGELQDRGLRIRAIRELVARIDKGELALGEWLGLEARLVEPWDDEEPRLMTEEELLGLVGERRSGLVADLVRNRFVERTGRSYLVPSPALLDHAVRLLDAGVDVGVTRAVADTMQRHLGRLADELVALYVKNAGDGFGAGGSAEELERAFGSVRPVALAMVQHAFAREMQRVLGEMVTSGAAARVPRGRS